MKAAITCLVVAIVATAGIPDDLLGAVGSLGATGVLGVALLWIVMRTLPNKDKAFCEAIQAMCERHDKWEHERHEDSVKLNETLQGLQRKE